MSVGLGVTYFNVCKVAWQEVDLSWRIHPDAKVFPPCLGGCVKDVAVGGCEVGTLLLERVQLVPDAESRELHNVVQVVV